MKNYAKLFKTSMALLMLGGLLMAPDLSTQNKLSTLRFDKTSQLRDSFSYKGDGTIPVSGHRGGYEVGYVENCIEGLKSVFTQMPVLFEIDPHLTKDSVIVLMHDATLDRTTTGKGKVKDYIWKEFQPLRLKDHSGKVTDCRILTLEEAIVWSKGRTIINLDKKGVLMSMIVALIKKYRAGKRIMLTVHTGIQARYYYDRSPDITMSAFARNMKEFEDISISGVPWENMVAYVDRTLTPENSEICEMLHAHEVRCMISVAPRHDKLPTVEERAAKYKEEINKRPDIIESDIPTEVWKVLHSR